MAETVAAALVPLQEPMGVPLHVAVTPKRGEGLGFVGRVEGIEVAGNDQAKVTFSLAKGQRVYRNTTVTGIERRLHVSHPLTCQCSHVLAVASVPTISRSTPSLEDGTNLMKADSPWRGRIANVQSAYMMWNGSIVSVGRA